MTGGTAGAIAGVLARLASAAARGAGADAAAAGPHAEPAAEVGRAAQAAAGQRLPLVHLRVEGAGDWTLRPAPDGLAVVQGLTGEPALVLRAAGPVLLELLARHDAGALAAAWAEGRLDLEGDLLVGLELLELLSRGEECR